MAKQVTQRTYGVDVAKGWLDIYSAEDDAVEREVSLQTHVLQQRETLEPCGVTARKYPDTDDRHNDEEQHRLARSCYQRQERNRLLARCQWHDECHRERCQSTKKRDSLAALDARHETVSGLLEAQRKHDDNDAKFREIADERAAFGRQNARVRQHRTDEQEVQHWNQSRHLGQYNGRENACPDDRQVN